MATGAGLGKVADVVTIEDHFDAKHRTAEQRLQELLNQLFGLGNGVSAALLPAANHPFKPPPANAICYPSELINCSAYKERFGNSQQIRIVSSRDEVRPDESVLISGSQVSNLAARNLFGNPFLDEPNFDVSAKDIASGWNARLRWNLCSPLASRELRLLLDGGEWKTHDHFLVDSNTGEIVKPRDSADRLEEDYLLITALPRYAKGEQRILWVSGIHRPGHIALQSLLNEPPVSELEKLKKRIGSDPYFQALFHVDVRSVPAHHEPRLGLVKPRELHPGKVTLRDAWSLRVRTP
jgi:hypothetical protein